MEGLATWRPFELDNIALWVGNVDRRAFSFRSVSGSQRACFNVVSCQLAANGLFVEGLDAEAKVIEVSSFLPWWRAAGHTKLTTHRNEVDKRASGPKLN